MKLNFIANSRVPLTAICGIALAAGVFTYRAQADQWDKKTILTVHEPIQVQERLLQPGSYVLRLLESNSNRHIVQIFNEDQSRIIDTVLAIPNYRLQPTGKSQFSFYETPPGTARALHAWFYPGDNFGQEFRRPIHNITLQASAATTVAAPVFTESAQTGALVTETKPAETQTEIARTEVAQTEVAHTDVAQTEISAERAVEEEKPVEMAQAAPPPPAPAAAPQEQPAELPRTGSPYTAMGLMGALSLGLYGLVRLVRTA